MQNFAIAPSFVYVMTRLPHLMKIMREMGKGSTFLMIIGWNLFNSDSAPKPHGSPNQKDQPPTTKDSPKSNSTPPRPTPDAEAPPTTDKATPPKSPRPSTSPPSVETSPPPANSPSSSAPLAKSSTKTDEEKEEEKISQEKKGRYLV